MGRELPVDCDECGGVLCWGDFGPFNDGTVGSTCVCSPKRVGVKSKMAALVEMYKEHHRGVRVPVQSELYEALSWVMDEVWMLRAENRELRIMHWGSFDNSVGKDEL